MSFGKDDPISPRVLDVSSALSKCCHMFRVLLGTGIRLRVRGSETVSRVFMDAAQFERMMLNLVLNARDAMPAGGSSTSITKTPSSATRMTMRATYVAILVRDTGLRHGRATRLNAFKPFFTTKGDRGTGLGLVIVDQIVSRAGGRVKIDSEVGRGTTIQIYLPRIAGAR